MFSAQQKKSQNSLPEENTATSKKVIDCQADVQKAENDCIGTINKLEKEITSPHGEFYIRTFTTNRPERYSLRERREFYSLYRRSSDGGTGSLVYVDLQQQLDRNTTKLPEYVLLSDPDSFEDVFVHSLVRIDYKTNTVEYIVENMRTLYPEVTGDVDRPNDVLILGHQNNKLFLSSRPAQSFGDWPADSQYYWLDLSTKEMVSVDIDSSHPKHPEEDGFHGAYRFDKNYKWLAVVVTRKSGFALQDDESEFIKIYDIQNNMLKSVVDIPKGQSVDFSEGCPAYYWQIEAHWENNKFHYWTIDRSEKKLHYRDACTGLTDFPELKTWSEEARAKTIEIFKSKRKNSINP